MAYPLPGHSFRRKKKRCPERFKVAQENLKLCQIAARRAGKLGLFYLDESGFPNIPNVQRAWGAKGKPHAADASATRQRVNVVGALDYARIHHNFDPPKLDGWLVEHRLFLVHLPPYCPELNPLEVVWEQAKYHCRRL